MGRQRMITKVFVALFSLGVAGGGRFILAMQLTGDHAEALVTDCHRRGRSTYCNGRWTVGGDPAAGGRVVQGTIEGAGRDDLGKTLDVRLSGDRAYTTSLRLPVILIGLGGVVALLGVYQLRRREPLTDPQTSPPDMSRTVPSRER